MEATKKSFWDLTNGERSNIVNARMRNSKYIVWDYARSKKDNSFGEIEELDKPIDKGFIHGFVMNNSSVVRSFKWCEFNVYGDNWYLDEKFEERTLYPYHFFSTYEKALEYSKKCKEYNITYKPMLSEVLAIVKKYDKDFRIDYGKRGYESVKYQAICKPQSVTTFTIDDNDNIIMNRGQMFTVFIISHIDLLDKILDKFYNGNYPSSEEMNNDIERWSITF